MRRPPAVTAAISVHLVATFLLAALSGYLLWLAYTPEIRSDSDAAEAIKGLRIGALALAVPAALWMPGVYAMWKRKIWGWWLTLLTGMGVGSILLYSTIDDGWGRLDPDDAVVTAVFIVFPLMLLLPKVRQYYRGPLDDPAANGSSGSLRQASRTS